jgi:hypothetical protein
MILIADSGSTKCDWALIDEKGQRLNSFQTMGLNPYFHSPDITEAALKKHPEIMEIASDVKYIFLWCRKFYTSDVRNYVQWIDQGFRQCRNTGRP